jgi:hypothetical protein
MTDENRIDRLMEYTSFHADLLIDLVNRVFELEQQNQNLSEALLESFFLIEKEIPAAMAVTHRTTLKTLALKEKGNKKEHQRQVKREIELLKSQVDYLNDKVKEAKEYGISAINDSA